MPLKKQRLENHVLLGSSMEMKCESIKITCTEKDCVSCVEFTAVNWTPSFHPSIPKENFPIMKTYSHVQQSVPALMRS